MEESDTIPLSAINHWNYCPRRCCLIHVEAEFQDNIHTMRGNAEHEHADAVHHETAADRRIETALPVWSSRLDLVGKCDVVEFLADGTAYPVEYKHGARKKWLNDDLQVAAQALCLEEMTGHPVPAGAIYHASSHRRREVAITDSLRGQVEATVAAIRTALSAGKLPPPVNDSRCRECSLIDLCQPAALSATERQRDLARRLFVPELGS